MTSQGLGDQELALLRYVAERGPVSAGQAASGFGEPRELARSTVLTMLERLRRKKRLRRRRVAGVFVYASAEAPEDVMRGIVERFVERTLGGTVSPFVDYLTDRTEVSETELAELEALVSRLQARRVRRKER